jgi:hypothetical protein
MANESPDKSILTFMDTAIKQQIYLDNVVYNYNLKSLINCDPALLILWRPELLSLCEYPSRLKIVLGANMTADDYKKFDEEISKPFRLMMSNIYANLKV